jgi:hypothetical protein
MIEGAPIGNAGDKPLDPILRNIYRALSVDMQRARSPALRHADRIYREFNEDTGPGPYLTEIRDAKTPEEAWNRMAGGGPKALNATKLMHLWRQLAPAQWDQVRGTVLRSLGEADPGTAGADWLGGQSERGFDAAKFVREWAKMSEEAKTVLFGDRAYTPLRMQLDRLVNTATDVKNSRRTTNWSNTAKTLSTLAVAGTRLELGSESERTELARGRVLSRMLVGS